MKNVSPILNIILLIAVAILYFLHFRSGSGRDETEKNGQPIIPIGNGNIVFINSDSLLSEYTYFKNKKVEFEAHQEKVKAELHSEEDKLRKEADAYQEKASMMSDHDRQQVEEGLLDKQRKLVQRKDELMGQLDDEQAKSTEELSSRIHDFLKGYNTDKKYLYVLGYQKGGGILFANESLDITRPVIDGLNKAYEEEAKK